MTDELSAWVDAVLTRSGRRRTGPPTVRADQPWGLVLRYPTAAGPVWLKRPEPGLRFEFAVLAVLARLEPRLTPTVLATDPVRGVALLADAGAPFCDAYDDDLPARYAAALVETGHLQRAAMPHVGELLAAGTPDLRPATAPGHFDDLVASLPDVAADAREARPRLVLAAERLSRSGIPVSIEHNDLHDGNILVDAAGRVTVVDWGDSVVTHPFAVLLVAERVLASLLGDVPRDHPAVLAARRDYLAVFADLAPHEDLEVTARLAVLVAHLGRAWAWQRALAGFAAAGRDPGRFAGAAQEWLRRGVRALGGPDANPPA